MPKNLTQSVGFTWLDHNSPFYSCPIWGYVSILTWNVFLFSVTGRYYGNCGWYSTYMKNGTKIMNYKACEKESDKLCGLLQCHHNQAIYAMPAVKLPLLLQDRNDRSPTVVCAETEFDAGKL